MPTAAHIAGVKAPGGIDGISFYPALTADPGGQPDHPYLFWEGDNGSQRTVRMGEWKSLTLPSGNRLYNLMLDPTEQNDLSAIHPGLLDQLNDIKQAEHRNGPPPVAPPVLKLAGPVAGS